MASVRDQRLRPNRLVDPCPIPGNELVAECVSEYLVRKAARAQLRDASNGTPELVSEWRLDAGAGRRYAALSGDYNPIHLSYLSARAFGFRGAIMQGMYSVARLALEFELRERRRVEAIDAQFLRPVFLPGDIQVFRSEATTFALSQKDKVCANVQVTATPRDRDESGCASAATRV